jgi:polyphosphate kinase
LKYIEAPVAARRASPDLTDPMLYLNRDLSLIAFQWRVFEEAQDPGNPLLERVKFLSILGTNVDEFLMVRAPELDEAGHGEHSRLSGGHRQDILEKLRTLMREARRYFRNVLVPELAAAGIHIVSYDSLSGVQTAQLNRHFREGILPALTPLALDPQRPLPHMTNLSMNLAVLIRDGLGTERFAYLQIPSSLPQLIPLQWDGTPHETGVRAAGFVWLEEVISSNLSELFPGMQVLEAHRFRITRNAQLVMEDWEPSEMLNAIQEGVRQRDFAPIVALLADHGMSDHLLDVLTDNLNLHPKHVFRAEAVLPLGRLMELWRLDRPELHDPPHAAHLPRGLGPAEDQDLFAVISQRDILLHHPFESFQPLIRLLEQAARDPDVLAIKMTLYRVGPNSPVIRALLDARRHGKQVTVVVELKARFDEENNVAGARSLEEAGAHVVYSSTNVKVHAKVCLIVRQEMDRVRSYVHIATGNYNPTTARVYTDLALLTCNDELAADAADLFNFLTAYAAPKTFRKMVVAPINLRQRIKELILREIEHARKTGYGHLIFKMNALVDMETIGLLYQASQAGVRMDLIVRGICCLRPGIPGVSDQVHVRSIVGRFLEHSRVYYFRNGGKPEMYLGSADLMPRNFDRRVEIMFPVEDERLRKRLREEILGSYLSDNVKARELNPDGTYTRVLRKHGQYTLSSQQNLLLISPLVEDTSERQ